MLVVNYFPGSRGDTIISQLSGLPSSVDNLNRTIIDYPYDIKYVEFYNKSIDEQKLIFSQTVVPFLENNGIIGAHRFNKLNYRDFDNRITVISIDPTSAIDQVVQWYDNKVFDVFGHGDQVINSILEKTNKDLKHIRFRKDIERWTKENILDTDVILDLKKYLDNPEYLNEFKSYYSKSS